MFDKAKMALTMLSPGMQKKVSLLSGWVEGLIHAVQESGVKLETEVKSQEDIQAVLLELLKKARIKSVEEKNALIVELGEEKTVRLIMSFKVVENEQ